MARNPRFDVLFEPVRIGPVTAPNRFYQVPHASGMTNALPQVRAGFREAKAEGGWGVVCTGAVSMHPSSDDSPLPFAADLWQSKGHPEGSPWDVPTVADPEIRTIKHSAFLLPGPWPWQPLPPLLPRPPGTRASPARIIPPRSSR